MKVFVYGTLKSGYGNNRLLSRSDFVSEAVVPGHQLYYSWRDGGFPVANRTDDPTHRIKGEIWDISADPTALSNLDRLEGVPHMYTREVVTTECGNDVSMYVGGATWYFPEMNLVPLNDEGTHVWGR